MGWIAVFIVAVTVLFAFRARRGDQRAAPEDPGQSWVEREGVFQEADEAFGAWTSGDLDRMLLALDDPTNPIDRHYLLLSIVEATYRQREEPGKRGTFLRVAQQHLLEFPELAGPLRADLDGVLPRVPTFQLLATVLAENGKYDDAVAACEQAIRYGLDDGTKSGFEGRIGRIRKTQSARAGGAPN